MQFGKMPPGFCYIFLEKNKVGEGFVGVKTIANNNQEFCTVKYYKFGRKNKNEKNK